MTQPWLQKIDTTKLIEKISGDWGISEDTQNVMFTKLASQRPVPCESAGKSSMVGISTVSTFVAKKSFRNFVVPPFAAHLGVVIDFDERTRFLYHLLFEVETRELTFDAASWKSKWSNHNIIQIGTTLYGIGEVYRMGKCGLFLNNGTGLQLSDAFKELGSYHFAFWNCQLFAKLFLKLICQDADAVNFGHMTSAEALRLICQRFLWSLMDRHFAPSSFQVRSPRRNGEAKCKGRGS